MTSPSKSTAPSNVGSPLGTVTSLVLLSVRVYVALTLTLPPADEPDLNSQNTMRCGILIGVADEASRLPLRRFCNVERRRVI